MVLRFYNQPATNTMEAESIMLPLGIPEVVELLGALQASQMQGHAYSTIKRAQALERKVLVLCLAQPTEWLRALGQAVDKRVDEVEKEAERLDKSFEIIMNALKNTNDNE